MFTQIGLPSEPQRLAILKGYIARHHTEMGEQGVASELLEDKPGAEGERCVGGQMPFNPSAMGTHFFTLWPPSSVPPPTDPALPSAGPGSEGLGAVSWIASNTDGFSGSDLVELCSNAAQRVLSEYWVGQRWVGGNLLAVALHRRF